MAFRLRVQGCNACAVTPYRLCPQALLPQPLRAVGQHLNGAVRVEDHVAVHHQSPVARGHYEGASLGVGGTEGADAHVQVPGGVADGEVFEFVVVPQPLHALLVQDLGAVRTRLLVGQPCTRAWVRLAADQAHGLHADAPQWPRQPSD